MLQKKEKKEKILTIQIYLIKNVKKPPIIEIRPKYYISGKDN